MAQENDQVAAGRWYLTAGCDCGGWIVISSSDGPGSRIDASVPLQLTCDLCGEAGTFGYERLRHVRAGDGGAATSE
jgi:hypothetical protein